MVLGPPPASRALGGSLPGPVSAAAFSAGVFVSFSLEAGSEEEVLLRLLDGRSEVWEDSLSEELLRRVPVVRSSPVESELAASPLLVVLSSPSHGMPEEGAGRTRRSVLCWGEVGVCPWATADKAAADIRTRNITTFTGRAKNELMFCLSIKTSSSARFPEFPSPN